MLDLTPVQRLRCDLGKISDALSRTLDQLPETGRIDCDYVRRQFEVMKKSSITAMGELGNIERKQFDDGDEADEPDTVLLPSNDPFLPKEGDQAGKDVAS